MSKDWSKLNRDMDQNAEADKTFLDKMSKEEREAWKAAEAENAEGWEENIKTISDEEMDEFMFRHGLGKYIYGKKDE